MVLAAVAAVLVLLMLWLRGGLHPEAPLERLARHWSLHMAAVLLNEEYGAVRLGVIEGGIAT